MYNQDNINKQDSGKNYFRKIIAFAVMILILVAVAVLADFAGKGSTASGTATLSWIANTEPDLAGYKIYYGTSPRTGDCPAGGYPEKIDIEKMAIQDKPSFVVKGLEAGKTYYFSVTSYDVSGNESCFQQEVSKSFPILE